MKKKHIALFLLLVSITLLVIIGVYLFNQPKQENNSDFVEPQPPIPSFSLDDVLVTGEERSRIVDLAVNDPEVKEWLDKGYEVSAVYEITAYAGKGIYSVAILTQEQRLPWIIGITLVANVNLNMEEVTNFYFKLELASLSEEQKQEVMNIAVAYLEENYGTDYVINGDVEVGSGGTATTFYAYPTASFRVPADYQQSGQYVNIMVDLETGEVVKVITTPAKSLLSLPLPTPEPGPSIEFHYNIEVDLESAEGFGLSRREDVNRDIQTFLVLHPGNLGTIKVSMVSTGNQDYILSLGLELSGRDSEFHGVDYSFSPSTLVLRAGGRNSSLLQIEADESAPTGYYGISVKAMTDQGGLGLGFPTLLVTPFTPEFIFTVKTNGIGLFPPPPGWTPPEGEIPSFEVEPGENISVLIFIMDYVEPLDLNVTSPPMIDFELLTDVIEIIGETPEPDTFYQINLKSNLETPEGIYTIVLNGVAGSYDFERSLILIVK